MNFERRTSNIEREACERHDLRSRFTFHYSTLLTGQFAAPLAKRSAQFPRSEHRLGFTLLELMVVLVLIGIVTAVIIPEMKGTYEDARLRSTSRQLIDVFNLASSRAVSLNQLHRVRLERKTGRYVVERRAQEGERTTGFISLRDIVGGDGQLDTRILIEVRSPGDNLPEAAGQAPLLASSTDSPAPLEDTIAFYPDGTADEREILLRDREGFGVALRLNPITARVHIIELERQ